MVIIRLWRADSQELEIAKLPSHREICAGRFIIFFPSYEIIGVSAAWIFCKGRGQERE